MDKNNREENIGRRKRALLRNTIIIWNIMILVSQLSACHTTELEDRCFPMIIMVDYDRETAQVIFDVGFSAASGAETQSGKSQMISQGTSLGQSS